ncbi:MAG TPA: hypothetical protein VE646_05455 [Actinomycetota bacterium]|nr:hypothetical protein [Actinomycetota bacterium]
MEVLAQYAQQSGGGDAALALVCLGFWALIVWGTYRMAVRNGRSGGLAIVLGLIFGIWALLGYAIAGPTSEMRARGRQSVPVPVPPPPPPNTLP